MTSAPLRDHARLHWVVFLWSLTAILGALLHLHHVATVTYRTGLAALSLALLFLLRSTPFPRLPSGEALRLVAIGALIGIHWALFFAAVKRANASVCLIGISTTTLWTALLEPLFTRRRLEWFEVFLGSLVVAGIIVIYQSGFAFQLGLSLALGAAVFAAIFGILNGMVGRRREPTVVTFYEMTGAFVTCLVLSLVLHLGDGGAPGWRPDFVPRGLDWLWLTILALGCTTYAYVAYVDLLKVFSVFVISLVANLEPVYGILLAALLLGEHHDLNAGFYVGAAIVILSIVAHPLLARLAHRGRHPTGG